MVAKRLLDTGLLHTDAITVTGHTIGEEASAAKETAGQTVIHPLSNPIKPTGSLIILKGNLAPEGCVLKLIGHKRTSRRGPARVFDCEEDAFAGGQARQTSPAPWLSSGAKVRTADPVCAKCSRSPPRSLVKASAVR